MENPPLLPADPKANYLAHREVVDEAIARVLRSGRYILGEEVAQFEKEFAAFTGTKHAVTVANGTDALELALRAAGIGEGDAVITAANTAAATVSAILDAGATPVLVDIDPATFTIDPRQVERALEARADLPIKAIVPVHLYGHPCAMPELVEIARRNRLVVIEDCAQAHGAEVAGRQVGSWGEMAAFSFYPTKNLGALGDGGAVVTQNGAFADRLRGLRQYGWRQRYISEFPGSNSRLDEIQAAILRAKLPFLAEENRRRRDLAAGYDRRLGGLPLRLPRVASGAVSVFHQYTVRLAERDTVKAHLERDGIIAGVLYPVPIHAQPGFRNGVMVGPGLLAETERAAGELLNLPLHPQLGEADLDRVAASLERWFEDGPTGGKS